VARGKPVFHRIVLHQASQLKEELMLWTIAVVLLVLWGLGLVSAYTMGGFIHVLLVAAVVIVLVDFIGGRRATP
jgi:hypothetical protein